MHLTPLGEDGMPDLPLIINKSNELDQLARFFCEVVQLVIKQQKQIEELEKRIHDLEGIG